MNSREKTGRLKRTGFTLIELVVVIVILGILVAIILPAIQQAREASRRTQCRANLHQIGVALHNYLDARGCFPPGAIKGYSTHVFLLPYIEQKNLYEEFDFNVEGLRIFPPNDVLSQSRISIYECPSESRNIGIGTSKFGTPAAATNYVGNAGTWHEINGIFQSVSSSRNKGKCVKPRDVRDGMSNTAMMAEVLVGEDAEDPRRMIIPTPRRYGPREFEEFLTACQNAPLRSSAGLGFGVPWINGSLGITRYNHVLTPNTRSCLNKNHAPTGIFTLASDHPGGVNLLVADGSVQFISDSIDVSVWRALGSINGGEPSKPAW